MTPASLPPPDHREPHPMAAEQPLDVSVAVLGRDVAHIQERMAEQSAELKRLADGVEALVRQSHRADLMERDVLTIRTQAEAAHRRLDEMQHRHNAEDRERSVQATHTRNWIQRTAFEIGRGLFYVTLALIAAKMGIHGIPGL
jgi:hypothetical protein